MDKADRINRGKTEAALRKSLQLRNGYSTIRPGETTAKEHSLPRMSDVMAGGKVILHFQDPWREPQLPPDGIKGLKWVKGKQGAWTADITATVREEQEAQDDMRFALSRRNFEIVRGDGGCCYYCCSYPTIDSQTETLGDGTCLLYTSPSPRD